MEMSIFEIMVVLGAVCILFPKRTYKFLRGS